MKNPNPFTIFRVPKKRTMVIKIIKSVCCKSLCFFLFVIMASRVAVCSSDTLYYLINNRSRCLKRDIPTVFHQKLFLRLSIDKELAAVLLNSNGGDPTSYYSLPSILIKIKEQKKKNAKRDNRQLPKN